MTYTPDMSNDDFQTCVLELVGREHGLGAMARYIQLNLSGRGDYTRDRHLWLGEQTLDPNEQPVVAESQSQAA